MIIFYMFFIPIMAAVESNFLSDINNIGGFQIFMIILNFFATFLKKHSIVVNSQIDWICSSVIEKDTASDELHPDKTVRLSTRMRIPNSNFFISQHPPLLENHTILIPNPRRQQSSYRCLCVLSCRF